MKKKLLLIVVTLFGLFYPFMSVNALTKINFVEQGNGQINTTLHFEEGFVGAIDVTFNIKGDVDVKDFKFSNEINSNNYGRNYKYNKDKHTIRVRVTTGGTGTNHNLLNSKKELTLGTIIFVSSAKEDVKYKVSETSFKIVDNNWASKTIEQSHITLGDTTQFTYKVTNISQEDPKENESSGNNTNKNTESSKNTVNTNDQSQIDDASEENKIGTKTTTSFKKKDNGKDKETTKDEVTSSKKETTKDKTKKSNLLKEKDDNKNHSEDKKQLNWIIPTSIIGVILISIGSYFFINKKRKNKK